MAEESTDNVAGLGNFKGVMLCNRPEQYDSRIKDPTEFPPFYSSIAQGALEPPGLLHPLKIRDFGDQKKLNDTVPPAVKKHKEWIKQYHEEFEDQKKKKKVEDLKKQAKFHATREHCSIQREEVRKVLDDAQENGIEADDIDFMNRLMDAVEGDTSKLSKYSKSPDGKLKPKKNSKKKKPAWACKDEEDFEKLQEGEADDLIDFAKNLDYSTFIDDLEFRQALQALKGRAGALKKEEDVFRNELVAAIKSDTEDLAALGLTDDEKSLGTETALEIIARAREEKDALRAKNNKDTYADDESSDFSSSYASSSFASAALRGGNGGGSAANQKKDEDNDTDMSPTSVARSKASEILKENAEIRGVHSKESLKAVLERADAIANQFEQMKNYPEILAPKIVLSDDRKKGGKIFDPSKIAYLYRSPAI